MDSPKQPNPSFSSLMAGFDLPDDEASALDQVQEDSSSSETASSASEDGEEGDGTARRRRRRKKKRRVKSAWSTISAKSITSNHSKLGNMSQAATKGDRDERYLKEYAAIAKKRSPLNKKFKFKERKLVYHGADPNSVNADEMEFENDWAPILIRASGKRMNPKKIHQLLPMLKQRIGKLVAQDPGIKRVIRPVYLRYTTEPKFLGSGFIVCFNFHGLSLSHAEIKAAIDSKLLSSQPNNGSSSSSSSSHTITAIQFIPLASQLEVAGMDNRWLVTFSRNDAKLELIRYGLQLRNSYVTVRDYADVQRIEIAIWSLLNMDKCDVRNSLRTPSADVRAASSDLGFDTFLSPSNDADKVRHMLLKRRNTYAEIRPFLQDL